MKSLIFIPFVIFISSYSNNSYARSLRATADKLGKEASQIGFGLALFGLAVGAIYLILGKQDAAVKITSTVFGILLLASSSTIVTFIKSVA